MYFIGTGVGGGSNSGLHITPVTTNDYINECINDLRNTLLRHKAKARTEEDKQVIEQIEKEIERYRKELPTGERN
jgi:hypothetical protein